MKATAARKTAETGVRSRAATTVAEKPMELLNGMWERIAQKAYELWEQRGRRHGHHLEDWLEAETLVMEELHESRE